MRTDSGPTPLPASGMSDARFLRLAQAQHSAISHRQLRALGLSEEAIAHRVADGRLERVHRGSYVIGGSQPTWERSLSAAVLAVRQPTVASHRSSARLWGSRPWDDTIEISVFTTAPVRLDGVVCHRLLDPPRRIVRHGIATTTPMRMLLDLGAVLSPLSTEAVFVDARARRLVDDRARRSELAAIGRRGRRGCGVLRRLLAEHSGLPAVDSFNEALVLRLVRDAGLPEPMVHHRLEDASGGFVAEVDFFWHEGVALEFMGYGPHSSRQQFEKDRRRARRITALGVGLVEITTGDLVAPEAWLTQLADAVRSRTLFTDPAQKRIS